MTVGGKFALQVQQGRKYRTVSGAGTPPKSTPHNGTEVDTRGGRCPQQVR